MPFSGGVSYASNSRAAWHACIMQEPVCAPAPFVSRNNVAAVITKPSLTNAAALRLPFTQLSTDNSTPELPLEDINRLTFATYRQPLRFAEI